MTTTFSFYLPFPLFGLPDDKMEATGQSTWVVGPPPEQRALATKLNMTLVRHENSVIMEKLGWKRQGSGTSTYTGDTKGMFAITEVEMAVEGLPESSMTNHHAVIYSVLAAINSFIEQHTAETITLWTPRATPQDIIGLNYVFEGEDGKRREGGLLSFGNMQPVVEALQPLHEGSPSLYSVIAGGSDTLWGRSMLDGLREFLAVRPTRACGLVAIGFELFLNSVLRGHPDLGSSTLGKKGQELVGPLIGGGLNSKRAHGEIADSWMLVLAGRNALLHREEAEFTWSPVDRAKESHNVASLGGAGVYITEAARLIQHVRQRVAE